MKDSMAAEGITNTRLQRTHTHMRGGHASKHTYTHLHAHKVDNRVVSSGGGRGGGLMGAGVWAERGAGAGRDGTWGGGPREPPLLLLNAGFGPGPGGARAGTGERSHTLGSKWPRGSLKTRGSREVCVFSNAAAPSASAGIVCGPGWSHGAFSQASSGAVGPADLHTV